MTCTISKPPKLIPVNTPNTIWTKLATPIFDDTVSNNAIIEQIEPTRLKLSKVIFWTLMLLLL